MKIKIEIECDNAAFEDNGMGAEVGRILRKIGAELDAVIANGYGQDGLPLRDSNGNVVGEYRLDWGCRTEGCGGDPDTGDGWDGYCPRCADRARRGG